MISVRFVLTASAMFAAAPALAQDAGDFSGARAEATIGLDQLRFDLAQVGSDGRAKQSDLGYGIAIGYDAAVAPRPAKARRARRVSAAKAWPMSASPSPIAPNLI